VTHPTLYPLWYDDLLVSGVHLLRTTSPDLSDLVATARRATGSGSDSSSATGDSADRGAGGGAAASAEAIAAAGRRRACELMHLPHLMQYVAALLRRYAARFEGAHTSHLHHAVRRLRESPMSNGHGNGTGARVVQPEALWAELGVPENCGDVWWHDPRCEGGAAT